MTNSHTLAAVRIPRGQPAEFRAARTCYDHLAGLVGVGLHDALIARGEIREASRDHGDIEVTAPSSGLVAGIALEVPRVASRRPAYACRDLTERTHHIGGALGAALCAHALREGWVERLEGTRALAITARGHEALRALGISLER
ncbi:MAG: hypothetical protein IT299_12275 [Dehalococcoidia bacterium]|nr:hypothetical protein [Dehalococcoidia bacterium]